MCVNVNKIVHINKMVNDLGREIRECPSVYPVTTGEKERKNDGTKFKFLLFLVWFSFEVNQLLCSKSDSFI